MKKLILFVSLLLLSVGIFGQDFSHLQPMQTPENCGCEVLELSKETEKTSVKGEAILYRDVIVVHYQDRVKYFYRYVDGVWMDSKENLYKLQETTDAYILTVKKTQYIIWK